jgi:translation initiation factor 5B
MLSLFWVHSFNLQGGEDGEAAASGPPTKGGKPVKESAMARKIREELERRQKAEEEARR